MNLKKFEGRRNKISATDVLYDNIRPCGPYLFKEILQGRQHMQL